MRCALGFAAFEFPDLTHIFQSSDTFGKGLKTSLVTRKMKSNQMVSMTSSNLASYLNAAQFVHRELNKIIRIIVC